MINPCTAETASDTVQFDIRNIFNGINEKEINQVSAKKNENQERNHQNNEAYEDADMDDDEQRLIIEVELNHEDASDADEAAGLALSRMVNLLKEWIKEGMIQGVHDVQGNVKVDNWQGVEE